MVNSDSQRESWKQFLSYHPEFASSVVSDGLDVESVKVTSWGVINGFQRAGKGSVTSPSCGLFRNRFLGCSNVKLHDRIGLDGVHYRGKVYMEPTFFSCHRASCPTCYESWAYREAVQIAERLNEASKVYGEVLHIVVSVPIRDYGLSYEALRVKAKKALEVRGVVGAVMIFHGERKNRVHHRYWSPHWHCLGFISDGYGHCRSCGVSPNVDGCGGCGGFEDRTRTFYLSDGFIVKVIHPKFVVRDVRGTAFYQLSHASYAVGVERFHVSTWYGVVSYRKLHFKVPIRKRVCPICGSDLCLHFYLGSKVIVTDRGSPLYVKGLFLPMCEGGADVWVPCPRGGGSSAYNSVAGVKPIQRYYSEA
jgi:hypothetical protein